MKAKIIYLIQIHLNYSNGSAFGMKQLKTIKAMCHGSLSTLFNIQLIINASEIQIFRISRPHGIFAWATVPFSVATVHCRNMYMRQ